MRILTRLLGYALRRRASTAPWGMEYAAQPLPRARGASGRLLWPKTLSGGERRRVAVAHVHHKLATS